MLTITYCSNDDSGKYGANIHEVHAGVLPYENVEAVAANYAHVVALDVEETDTVMLTPAFLVIDMTGETPVVRAKNDSELLVDYRPQKAAEIITGANVAMQVITETYSENEKLSWSKQETEAKALLLDADAPAPLLRTIAQVRGIDLTELRDKVLANVSNYELATGHILGAQQKYEDQLKAATTLAEAQAVNPVYA